MKYTVIWSPQAESALAEAWLDAANRNAVSAASSTLERAIGKFPLRVGRPLASSVNRIAVISPLEIAFDIIEDDKKVIVQSCWLVG